MEIERKKVDLSRGKTKITRVPAGKMLPNLDDLLTPDGGNPFDKIEYIDDVETDSLAETSTALAAIVANKQRQRAFAKIESDTEFWFAVCFQSRAQKEEFLEKAGWTGLVQGDKYLDGLEVSRAMEVDIEPIFLPIPTRRIAPKGLRTEGLIMDEPNGQEANKEL